MTQFNEIKYLLGDIKSPCIIKRIFLFLNEKQKLNLIIYNKQLQNILGLDIKAYKKINEKYKIDEKKGKGREHSLFGNKLIILFFLENNIFIIRISSHLKMHGWCTIIDDKLLLRL